MNESLLNLLYQLINIGTPIVLLGIFFWLKKKPTFLLCGVCAIVPILLFFLYVTVTYHLTEIKTNDLAFSYGAMWVMAGWVGPALIIIGLLIGRFLLNKRGAIINSLIGFSVAPLIWLVAFFANNT